MDIDQARREIEAKAPAVEAGDKSALEALRPAIDAVLAALDVGKIRVAHRNGDHWDTEVWIKQAILFYFRVAPMQRWDVGPFTYVDKIPLKHNYEELKVRVVPPATARYGSFMEPGTILMPCYVNIGAYVGAGTMVDTWATVGSCAQVGANVHLSGGVGLGGVLEPAGATPVIIEDGAFIGSRCIVVEGVRVGSEAVLAANVTLTSSTPIIDARGSELKESRGHIPSRAVVVPGTKDKKVAGGTIALACAYIIGERKPSTDLKTSLTQVLREFAVSV